ncbi:MAG: TonB-dependent receptor domain-containing protein [Bryobacteraceae bacterium]
MKRFAQVLLLSVFASLCFSQVFTANLTGVVTDPKGSAIPNANVRIRNTATNDNRETKTAENGRFTFSQIPPGAYELTTEATGFKTFVSRRIELVANQSGEVDVALEIGEMSQKVEVAASVVQLDTQTANQSVTLDSREVLDLPVNARNPFVLVHATAGVVAVTTGVSTATQDQNHNRFAMNGGRDESAAILLDGVSSTAGDWSGLIISPSVDSVQEVQVMRNNYEAQFGKSGGGVVSMVTKGGANDFHGTGFEFLRNDHLDANNFFNNRVGKPKITFQRNQFGGNFGGPIWKSKKIYFFGGYEGLRQGTPSTTNPNVPTDLERAGDFSQSFNKDGSLSVIYNPFTTRPDPAHPGQYLRDPFPGNKIPANLIDPVGQKVANLFPHPNTAGDPFTNTRNFFGSGKSVAINDRFDARIDWAHSEKHTFFVRVSKAWEKGIAPVFFGNGADSNNSDANPRHQVVIGNTFVPNPTWVVNLLVGHGRWREEQDSPSKGLNGTAIGFSPSLVSQLQAQTIPQFTFGNSNSDYAQISNQRFLSYARISNNIQVNVTKEKGVHSIRFGFTAEAQQMNDTDVNSGSFNFTRGFTSGPVAQINASNSGNTIASLLLGTGNSGTIPNVTLPAMTQMYYGGYLQDAWRVGQKLTVNYGVRYELQRGRTERYDRVNYFDFNAPSPLAAATGLPFKGGLRFVTPSDRGQWDTDPKELAPRVGIAYKLTDKIVLRTGYGIFYLQTAGGGTVSSGGFSTSTAWVGSTGGDGIHPASLLSNPFPQGLSQPVGRSQGLATLAGQSISAFQRSHPSGYVQNYSLDLQWELSQGAVLELGYAGNQGRKLLYGYSRNADQLPDQYLSLGSALDDQVPNPFYGVLPSNSILGGATIPRNRLLRPYPQFTAVNISGDTPGATSSFNAAIVKITKRFSAGLSVMSSYQFSKAIDNASETQSWEISDNYRDYYNDKLDRSISGHDVPHSFVTAVIYELPVGKGKRFGGSLPAVANAVLGGWQVSAITRFASGLPLQATAANTLSNYGFPLVRPNSPGLKQLDIPNRNVDRWFNTAALVQPAPFTIGLVPRWIPNLRFEPTHTADVALMKNFVFHEHIKAQFRAESFNVSNTPQFGRANTDLTSPSYGVVSGLAPGVTPRNVQLGLKIYF